MNKSLFHTAYILRNIHVLKVGPWCLDIPPVKSLLINVLKAHLLYNNSHYIEGEKIVRVDPAEIYVSVYKCIGFIMCIYT